MFFVDSTIMFARLKMPEHCRTAGVLVCLIGLFLSLTTDGFSQTKSVATSMRGFGVPFRVNASDDSFIEVQLYVSRDLGKTWQFHSRQSTDLEEFPFYAEQDGTYWFALKTLNRDRRLVPDGDIVKPELEIVVDTKKPDLDFRIETDAAGRVACRWKATDENIRPDSLEILYQPGLPGQVNENAWQAVDVQLADATVPANGIYADQVAWWPEPNLRQISVRLKISDTAGNSIYEDRNVILPLVAWRNKSNSIARPPGRNISGKQIPLSLNRFPKTKKYQTNPVSAGDHPPGVVCENGFCQIVKSSAPPHVSSAPIERKATDYKAPNAVRSQPLASELYGMAVPRPRVSNSVARVATPRSQVAKQVVSNQQRQSRQLPMRTAQSSHPQTRAPVLNLVGSEAQPVAPPVPDGYVHVAAKPAAAPAPQQLQSRSAVTWESESYRWGPRNQSAFATTLKPDPSLIPASQSARSSDIQPQVTANPSIHFQTNDQQISQSSTNFPNNQYQGVVPTVPSTQISNHPPQLMPGTNSGQPVATNRQLVSKPPTNPPRSSTNVNSLGPLQNYSDNRPPTYQPSAYAKPRPNSRSLAPVVDPNMLDRNRSANVGTSQTLDGNKALQMISSKRFRLDYAINAIDPSGVAKVDLWMTRDNGREWTLWGSDPDSVSPFPVQVNDEGRYGFRVVIHSKDGLTGQGPSRGDPPDMYVHVDSQPPLAKITSVPYGRGNEAGRLVINWAVSDPFISLRPIRLSYSRGPTGPWTVIEDGLRNVGRFVWKVEPNVPERIFLKIEATDQAGNVGVHQLSQSIDISGLVPRGTIRGVVPVGR